MKYSIIILVLLCTSAFGQKKERPYRGGFVTKDVTEIKTNFNAFYKFLKVKKGERVASVGAKNGYIEVQVATMVDSVNWTLQDIDTTYLNKKNFEKVLSYHERLKSAAISGEFTLVVGGAHKTNLLPSSYNRVLLINVYHELSDPKSIISDVTQALKSNGELVIMEKMGSKRGQIHRDCKYPMLWEPEFIDTMEGFGFKMVSKEIPDKKLPIVYYTFNKA